MFIYLLKKRLKNSTLSKGLSYAESGNVSIQEIVSDNDEVVFYAKVAGTDIYNTNLSIDNDIQVFHDCTCLAHTYRDGCKHVAGIGHLLDDIIERIYLSSPSSTEFSYGLIELFGDNKNIVYQITKRASEVEKPTDIIESLSHAYKKIGKLTGNKVQHTLEVLNNFSLEKKEKEQVPEKSGTYEYRLRIMWSPYSRKMYGQIIKKKRYKNGKISSGKEVKIYEKEGIPRHIRILFSIYASWNHLGDGFDFSELTSDMIDVIQQLPWEYKDARNTLSVLDNEYKTIKSLEFTIKAETENKVSVLLHIVKDGIALPFTLGEFDNNIYIKDYIFFYNGKSTLYIIKTKLNETIITMFQEKIYLTREEFDNFLSQPGADVLLDNTYKINLPPSSDTKTDKEGEVLKLKDKEETSTDAIEGELVIMPEPHIGISLRIDSNFGTIETHIIYLYEDYTIGHNDPRRYIKNTENVIIKRDKEKENRDFMSLHETLIHLYHEYDDKELMYHYLVGEDVDLFFDEIDKLIATGTHVQYEQSTKKFSATPVSVSLNISTGIDWFETDVEIKHGEKTLDESDIIMEALRSGAKTVTLKDGMTVLLKEDLQSIPEQLDQLGIDTKKLDIPQKIGKYAFGLLHDDGLNTQVKMTLDKEARKLKKDLAGFTGVGKKKEISGLKATLRDYQIQGYNWLLFLHTYNFGGVLADDMGLGKTIQTIALLCHIYAKKKLKKPSIVICPTSLTYNRQDELAKFSPHLSVGYISSSKDDIDALRKQHQIIIVSYGIMANIVENGWNKPWYYVILDESQNIKNPNTKRAQSISAIEGSYRLALSGTPIENNILELRSVFNFLMPGFLGSQRSFEKLYNNGDEQNLKLLSRKIKPFVLRRTKEGVLTDLPPKVEEVITLEMEPKQKIFYNRLKETYKNELMKKIDTDGFSKSQFAVLDALLKLRQCCLSPQLVNISNNDVTASIKLTYLKESIEEMVNNGHNVLIFSQFTGFLAHITDILEKKKITYKYLDGQTPAKKRKELVNSFNNGDAQVFVISLKAGGTGLNLTAADYVIHMDPRRNPAVEDQATDRAHRMGQKKTVFVQKLIVKDSIEEKILTLQAQKKDLVDQVMSGSTKGKLTQEDVQYIFS